MQSYGNHTHRPQLWAIGFFFWLVASGGGVAAWLGQSWGRPALTIGLLGTTAVLLMIGRVYLTRLQDRIILLEMRVRGASLLTPVHQQMLASLPKSRVVALRFASGGELPALLERTVAEGLTADAIKRAVTQRRPDDLRT